MPKNDDIYMKERIYNHIKDMILTRELKCGEKIPEQKIAEQLKVSRTPVREAVRKLAWDGVVNIFPNRSAEVIELDEQLISDLGVVRWQLDSLSMQLAVYNGSNKEFDDLREIAMQCIAANNTGDLLGRIKYDSEFHLFLIKIGKNSILYSIQEKLHVITQLWQAVHILDPSILQQGLQDHLEIVDTLEKRDAAKGVELIRKHLSNSYGTEGIDFEKKRKILNNL